MGRPKHTEPATFTGGEITLATGLSLRNQQYLRDERLGPFTRSAPTDGRYSEDEVAELSMITATAGAGFDLAAAAALNRAFLEAMGGDGGAARWCGVDRLWSPDPEERAARYRPHIACEGECWFHRFAILRASDPAGHMRLTAGCGQDAILIVADRRHVGEATAGQPRLPRLVGDGVDPAGPFPLGEMRGLVRGASPSFHPLHEAVNMMHAAAVARAEAAFQAAVADALAVVRVNLSLAVRRGFDAIYTARRAKGGPLWPDLEGAA